MKVRALRGVCIGVDSHLKAGDTADLDAAQVTFLAGIGAVERVPDDPLSAPSDDAEHTDADRAAASEETQPTTPAKKAGKKE